MNNLPSLFFKYVLFANILAEAWNNLTNYFTLLTRSKEISRRSRMFKRMLMHCEERTKTQRSREMTRKVSCIDKCRRREKCVMYRRRSAWRSDWFRCLDNRRGHKPRDAVLNRCKWHFTDKELSSAASMYTHTNKTVTTSLTSRQTIFPTKKNSLATIQPVPMTLTTPRLAIFAPTSRFLNFLVNLPTNFRIPYKTRTMFLLV